MLIRFGLGGQMSGSVGGVTAGHNKGGQYLRNRSIPTNPNTARQQLVRSCLAECSQSWKLLTAAQRGRWEQYATATPLVNRLGESVTVSGFNMYVRTNTFLKSIRPVTAPVTEAPTSPGQSILPPLATQSPVYLRTNGDFEAPLAAEQFLRYIGIFIGPSVSDGVSSFKGPYTFAALSAEPDAPPAAQLPATRYGNYVEGENRPFRIAGIDQEGRLSNTITGIVRVSPAA